MSSATPLSPVTEHASSAENHRSSEVSEHIAAAKGYDVDRDLSQRRERRILWAWALTMTLVAVVAIVYAAMKPQSVVKQPFVAWIDSANGTFTNLTKLEDKPVLYGERLSRTWITRYVICREGWTLATYQNQWDECSSFSSERTLPALQVLYDWENPASHYKRYGKDGSVIVTVTRIVPYPKEPDKYDVHFTLTETIGGVTSPPSYWASQVKIAFNAKYSNELYNPLGMKVLAYQRDKEVVQ